MDKEALLEHINEIESMRVMINHYLDGIKLHLDNLRKSLNMRDTEPTAEGTMPMSSEKRLFTTKEAAEYLGVGKSTLDQSRLLGNLDLPFVRLERSIRYRREDLDLYISKLKVYKNTSEPK